MLVLALTAATALAQECEDPERWLDRAEGDVAGFYLAEAEVDLEKAEAAFGCSGPATATQAARMHTAQGVLGYLRATAGGGSDDAATYTAALASGRAADPEAWNPDFGEPAREVWAAAEPAGADGTVEVRNVVDGEWVRIDGAEVTLPAAIPPGPHLVQVGAGERARYALRVSVPAGERVAVTAPVLGGGTDSAAVAPVTVVVEQSQPNGELLRTLGIVGIAGGATILGIGTVYYQTSLAGAADDDLRRYYFNTWLPLMSSGGVVTATGTGLLIGGLVKRAKVRKRS